MKRTLFCILVIFVLAVCMPVKTAAAGVELFDDSLSDLRNSLSDDVLSQMEDLGYDDMDIKMAENLDLSSILALISDSFSKYLSGPFSSAAIIIAIIILSSLLESYTFSLRYTDMKDVMGVVTAILIVSALAVPASSMITSAVSTIRSAASFMLLYVPVMIGIMAFSGHLIKAGGYYTTVMAASQGIAQLASTVLTPLLSSFLAISVCAGISERIRLQGICEMLSKLMKWTLTFAMTIFTAVLSIQGFAANSVDNVATRAVKFTLSSFIPLVGSAISEAYKTIQNSVDLLRSGVGIFVIIAVFVTFLPVIIQCILWMLSVNLSKMTAEALGIAAPVSILTSISLVLSILLAVTVSVMSVFIISTSILISLGGGG